MKAMLKKLLAPGKPLLAPTPEHFPVDIDWPHAVSARAGES
jgi:hypothetical protein